MSLDIQNYPMKALHKDNKSGTHSSVIPWTERSISIIRLDAGLLPVPVIWAYVLPQAPITHGNFVRETES